MTNKTVKLIGDIVFYVLLVALAVILLCQVGVFPYRMVYVRSGSMAPVFNTGDLAIVHIDSNYMPHVGDIIMFSEQGSDVIHRYMGMDNGMMITKGDANNAPDVLRQASPKGQFLFSIPLLGFVFVFVQNNIFWIIMIILIVILFDLLHSNKVFPFNKGKQGG